mmetsp:Transcript_27699/g.20803  ORF Transcript_27699/g.20803 Transcript_27699/m.20803 type:complete len:84 (-) Transcript_27699:146-397(-)
MNQLRHLDQVFIVKKANFINCLTCYCCVGDNVYKVYKYRKSAGEKQGEIINYDLEGGENDLNEESKAYQNGYQREAPIIQRAI